MPPGQYVTVGFPVLSAGPTPHNPALRGRLTWQVAAVASLTRETPSVCTIELEPPDWPGHRAGQHLDVRLTAKDGYTAERSYSIASGIVPLRSILRHHNGVQVTYTLTRGQPPGWRGHTGRIDTVLPADVTWPAAANPLAIICGPTGFVEIAAAGLAGLGYPPERVEDRAVRGHGRTLMGSLDGNAIGGLLIDVFGADMTTATSTCAVCSNRSQVAELVVYLRAPGTVVRCRACGNVLMVFVKAHGMTSVDLPGLASLSQARAALSSGTGDGTVH